MDGEAGNLVMRQLQPRGGPCDCVDRRETQEVDGCRRGEAAAIDIEDDSGAPSQHDGRNKCRQGLPTNQQDP